ncbi:cytochrome P450 [Aspergillus karnatakaensis]|uniref:cytochrome P450 n=1 Tax=Aspergillus karnatakaensis TaxID=1810916 RepID=UPI003CCCFE4A
MALLAVLGIGLVAYALVLGVYRLYFHPLSHIPGPKLAALTHGYEFYYNVIKGGMFIWEIKRLHDVYGPIIRINPREVHILDPDYFDEIYASTAHKHKRNKDPVLMAKFGLEGAGVSTIDADTHRQRRAPVDRFFSKRAIEASETLIRSRIDKLVFYLQEARRAQSVVSLDDGFAALTSDIIYEYVYGFNPGSLDKPGFNAHVRAAINGLMRLSHLLYFFPMLQTVMESVPLHLLEKLNPAAFALATEKNDLYDRGIEALGKAHLAAEKKTDNLINALAATTLPEEMRRPERLMNEGFALVSAGTETTARSLAVGLWHIYSREDIRDKLREELKTVMPSPDSRPTWNQLEKLPYLSGVVNESLRLSTGIGNRSARVAPTIALEYNGYTLPPGTVMSQIHYFILMNPEIYPNPEEFDPNRWARAAANGVRLDRYLVNFGRGSRICLGINLAYAELFLVIATLVRRFDMEIYETPKTNIEFARDFGTPWPLEGGLSVRATITSVMTE